LLYQGTILNYSGNRDGAYDLVEEAYQVALKVNLTELVSQIKIRMTGYD